MAVDIIGLLFFAAAAQAAAVHSLRIRPFLALAVLAPFIIRKTLETIMAAPARGAFAYQFETKDFVILGLQLGVAWGIYYLLSSKGDENLTVWIGWLLAGSVILWALIPFAVGLMRI